jgi:hypothetical protein
MDLNYYLARHQISLMRADGAACIEARLSHLTMAKSYEAKIKRFYLEHDANIQRPAGVVTVQSSRSNADPWVPQHQERRPLP